MWQLMVPFCLPLLLIGLSARTILAEAIVVPQTSWRYKAEDSNGPMFPKCLAGCSSFHDVLRTCSQSESIQIDLACFCKEVRLSRPGHSLIGVALTCDSSCSQNTDRKALKSWYMQLCHREDLEVRTKRSVESTSHDNFAMLFVEIPLLAISLETTGHREAMMALGGIFERQSNECVPVPAPATCEKSCGPGNIECVSFPTCYTPGVGETCCSNGSMPSSKNSYSK